MKPPVTHSLKRAVDAYGGYREMARSLDLSEQAVRKWQRVPEAHVARVSEDTGIPRWELRPDLYWREVG